MKDVLHYYHHNVTNHLLLTAMISLQRAKLTAVYNYKQQHQTHFPDEEALWSVAWGWPALPHQNIWSNPTLHVWRTKVQLRPIWLLLWLFHDLALTTDIGQILPKRVVAAPHCWSLQGAVDWHVYRNQLDQERTRTRWHYLTTGNLQTNSDIGVHYGRNDHPDWWPQEEVRKWR